MSADRPAFDASKYLRTIKIRGGGSAEYLPAWARVLWLRYDHPTAQILSEELLANDKAARFKCTITLPNGAIAVAHGSENAQAFPDFYEKAETVALSRACAVLGYGTEGATDLGDREPEGVVHAQVGDRCSEQQARWLFEEGKRRGIRLSDRPQQWSSIIGALARAGIDMGDVADDQGVIPARVAERLIAFQPAAVAQVDGGER